MTNPTTAELLRKAKARISTPEMWHKGSMFSGLDRETCPACAYGALFIAANGSGPAFDDTRSVLDAATRSVLNYGNTHTYNDNPSTTHADIMALFDVAIDMAEKDAQ